MITGTQITDKGYRYTWHGQAVPKEVVPKPMSYGLRLYMIAMGELVEKKDKVNFSIKLRACQKTFGKKGPQYVNILHHFEAMEEWL